MPFVTYSVQKLLNLFHFINRSEYSYELQKRYAQKEIPMSTQLKSVLKLLEIMHPVSHMW